MKKTATIAAALMMTLASLEAQTVVSDLKTDVNRAAGINYAQTMTKPQTDTPAPGGKKPFYISQYACPTSFYLEKPEYYDEPYDVFAKADSLGKLTKLGRDVLHRLELVRSDAEGRTGEMTAKGGRQVRAHIQQLVEHFPEVFTDSSTIDARSIVQNHCIQMASEAMVQIAKLCHAGNLRQKTSHKDQKWLNPQDKQLTDQRADSLTMARYKHFADLNSRYSRLIEALFNDQNYVVANVEAEELCNQLFTLAGSIQHTALAGTVTLYDIFTLEEIHRHWRTQNAWNYICYGNCELNGGHQAYVQRETLWNMLHQGDSIMGLDAPVVHLRYTNSGVLLSLACLMELDGYGLATSNLDSLETLGWADYRIAPMGGSIELIHYRSSKDDSDPLVKVLLNGREAKLPIETDCAPYYHWIDVKRYYLRKLYRYEKARQDEDEKKK